MIFGRKKFVLAIFACEIRLYSRAARKRKILKSRNFAFFLVFRGIKYVQSFKTLAAVVFEIDRGVIFTPPQPALSSKTAQLGKG